jgi:hypothetical protein
MMDRTLDAQILVYLRATHRGRTVADIGRALEQLQAFPEEFLTALARLQQGGRVERLTDPTATHQVSWRAVEPLPR